MEDKNKPVWWKPFVQKEMWIKTFTGPCAASSVAMGTGTAAIMSFQKYRVKKSVNLAVLNWSLFTFTFVTCASYYLCGKNYNDRILTSRNI